MPRVRSLATQAISLGFISLIALPTTSASADTIFVNASQLLPGVLQTGNSWTFAYKDLQEGLGDATSGDEVWVADGTYRPTSTGDRAISFVIPDGVRVLGGFAGNETEKGERRPLENKTILSGDIGIPGNADNSFHVVTANSAAGPATILSGFFVTGANANGGGVASIGGGIRWSGSGRVSECFVFGNTAVTAGGGLGFSGGAEALQVVSCVFTGNTANTGGGLDLESGEAHLFMCTIVGNTGGGVRFLNTTGADAIDNCIVRGNTGSGTVFQQQLSITNANVAAAGNNIEDSLLAESFANVDVDPKFVDADGSDNLPGTIDDNFRLRGDSPSIDQGSSNNIPADSADLDGDGQSAGQGIPFDLAFNPRRVDDSLSLTTGLGSAPYPDAGAFEFKRPRTVLVDKDATGANNGISWEDAYIDLQLAIFELGDPKFGGDGEIWVAEGTYKPTTTTNQTISFKPPLSVQIYGGFAGGELARDQRDWIAHPTILSGEIGAATSDDNTDVVVRYNSQFHENDAVLDGFVVTRGNGGAAGGIVADSNASPTIRNCRIIDNKAGILFVGNLSATAVLDNCIVAGNTIGGIGIDNAATTVTNCTIAGNVSPQPSTGAGISVTGGDAKIRNCLVFQNVGNGVVTQNSQISNAAGTGFVTALVSCCAIESFGAGYANDVNCIPVASDGGCIDANGADNVFGTLDDDFSPTNCFEGIDAGDNAASFPDALDYDDDGNVSEALNQDFGLGLRKVDLSVPNSGLGAGGIDIGAFEKQALVLPSADIDGDGTVGGSDLGILLGAWNTNFIPADLNGDCFVDAADLAILLGAWGP